MAFDPDAYLAESSFDPDEYLRDEPSASMAESGLRGASQGFSLGFDDEIAGGLSVLGRPFGVKGLGGKLSDIELTSPTLNTDEILGEYTRVRDLERKANEDAQKSNPGTYLAGQIAGGAGSAIVPGLNVAKGAGLLKTAGMGAAQGGLTGLGMSDKEDLSGLAVDTGLGAGLGGIAGAGAYGAGKLIEKGADKFKNFGGSLKSKAEDLAIKATGATGKQAEGFADDAGRQLLDRDLIRFGDTPENIAGRLDDRISESGSKIQKALEKSTGQGAKIDLLEYLGKSETKVNELRRAGKFLEADAIEAQTNKIIENADKLRVEYFDPITMENIKRESQAGINYMADAKPTVAGKKVGASMQRQAVEDAMRGLDKNLSKQFVEEKKLFGLLNPIQEAAEKRSSQLNQSPFGGLGDIASTAAGGGNPMYAAARRMVAPRLASSAAVSLDKIGTLVQKSPQKFGKYAQVLQSAAQRGPQGVASTHFLLQQSDEDYRELLKQIAGDEDNNIKEVGYGYPER